MFISKIKVGLQIPDQKLKKIYRDILIFGLIGFLFEYYFNMHTFYFFEDCD